MRLTAINHDWFKTTLQHGDVVVDATIGNGFDALFLAQCVGETGHLYGFDVQAKAIQQSQQQLANTPCHKTLYHQGHEHWSSTLPLHIQGHIQAVMFNLGWLPHSDKRIITQSHTTIAALAQAIGWLANGGKLSLMLYPGHAGGDVEADEVACWLEATCQQYETSLQLNTITVANKPTAPILLQLTKSKQVQLRKY